MLFNFQGVLIPKFGKKLGNVKIKAAARSQIMSSLILGYRLKCFLTCGR